MSTTMRVRSVADWFVASDPGWGRARTGWRMLVSMVAGLAAGYGTARGLGQPALLGMTVGGVVALVSAVVIPDAPIRHVARRISWLVVPYAVALLVSVSLAPHRAVALPLIILFVFLQFYLARFGHDGQQFGVMMFAAYLSGLLAPIPLHLYPRFLVMVVAVVAACIVARAMLCWYSPAWDLRQTRGAFEANCRRAAASAVGVLQGRERARRRLRRDLDRVNTAALVFDGRLGHEGMDERIAEHLHREVLHVEHALVSLTLLCEALAEEQVPVASAAAVAQLAALAAGRPGDPGTLRASAAALRTSEYAAAGPGAFDRVCDLLEQAAEELDAYGMSSQILTGEVLLAAEAAEVHLPFKGVVALEGARPAGVRPLAQRAAEAARHTWWLNSQRRATGQHAGVGRVRRPTATTTKAIQAAIAMAIVLPLGDAFDSQHYYWAVIGVQIIAGGSTPHDRGRKVIRRLVGTVLGAVVGIVIYDLIGQGHTWWTLTVLVLALSIGASVMAEIYAVWVFFLVIALVELYGLSVSGEKLDILLAHRLTENAIGAVIASVVSLIVLPISTRAAIRVGLHGYLKALSTFAVKLGEHLTDPGSGARIRSASRALDHALFQTRQVAAHLVRGPVRSPGSTPDGNRGLLSRIGGRRQRLDELAGFLSTAARQVRTIARHAPHPGNSTGTGSTLVTQIIDTLTTSIAALDHSLDGHGHHEWTSCGPLIRQLLNQLSDEDAHLAPTLRTLEELDTCLATAATRLGLTVIDDHHERQLTQPRIAP